MKPIVFQKQKQKQIQQTIKSISSQNLTKTRKHVLGSSRQENLSFIVLQIDFLFIFKKVYLLILFQSSKSKNKRASKP